MELSKETRGSKYHPLMFSVLGVILIILFTMIITSSSKIKYQVENSTTHLNQLINVQHVDSLVKEIWIELLQASSAKKIANDTSLKTLLEIKFSKIETIREAIELNDLGEQDNPIKVNFLHSLNTVLTQLKSTILNKPDKLHIQAKLPSIEKYQISALQFILFLDTENKHIASTIDDEKLNSTRTVMIFLLILAGIFCFLLYRSTQTISKKYKSYLEFVHNFPQPISMKDTQGRFTYINKVMASLFEKTMEEVLGKKIEQIHLSDDFSQLKDKIHLNKDEVLTKDNQHYQLSDYYFEGSNGENYQFHIGHEVSELITTRNESLKAQNKLQRILHISEEGLWELNLRDNTTLMDPACREIMGFGDGDFTYEEYMEMIHEDDKGRVLAALHEGMESQTNINLKYRFRKKNGEIVWIWDRGLTLFNELNEPETQIGIVQDITKDKRNQDRVHKLAFYDPLTSLPNRELATQHLEKAISSSVESNNYSALFLLDLDRFKILNDSYGHQIGDQLLIKVANKIQSTLHKDDVLARFGGDEFIIITNQLGLDIANASGNAKKIAKKIKDALSIPFELKLKTAHAIPVNYFTTTSIGGVLFKNNSHDTDTLLKLSDIALHKVKMQGGNDVMLVDPELQNQLNLAADMYKSLSCAIENNELALFYQPQYNAKKEMVGAEALIRWNSSKFGMVPPDKFIPIAEESNLIIEIGYWVLTQACQQLELWQKNPLMSDLRLSVNLSAKQIWQEDFIFLAKNIIRHYDFDPALLTFEITESILIRDVQDTIAKLNELKEIGSIISLDDFGTGYSSLSYLKNFPIDEIKIDRSFIQNLNTDHSDLLMVKSIIKIGENFGLEVVAEGVEDAEQFNTLANLGCIKFQGYLLNRPLPICEFLEVAHKENA